MKIDIEEYLQSPRAVADAARMAPWLGKGAGMQDAWCLSCTPHLLWSKVRAQSEEIWRPGAHWVYIRPEGARFIVSDMGEAVRALRMRTGVLPVTDAAAAVWADIDISADASTGMHGDAFYAVVSAGDLPRAIVRTMLASFRVANLETS